MFRKPFDMAIKCVIAAVFAVAVAAYFRPSSFGRILITAPPIFAGFVVWYVTFIEAAINRMYPPAIPVRHSTVVLTPEGYFDIMPSSTMFVPWQRLRTAEITGLDIYFVGKPSGSYFPCVMRNTPECGRLLVDTANELRVGKEPSNSNLPIILPESALGMFANGRTPNDSSHDQGIWPPPPLAP
jgi:hypothetical protein